MILSHRYRFIFVHNPKTGGTSLHEALAPFGRRGGKLGLKPHSTLAEIEKAVPDVFRNYFKFAFVRNPWDLEVSRYCYKREWFFRNHPSVNWKADKTFEQFIQERHDDPKCHNPQFRRLCDAKGELAADFIGRFENLKEDFQFLLEKIGLSLELPHANRSQRGKDYRDYYTTRLRDMVEAMATRDIEAFQYDFESMPCNLLHSL